MERSASQVSKQFLNINCEQLKSKPDLYGCELDKGIIESCLRRMTIRLIS